MRKVVKRFSSAIWLDRGPKVPEVLRLVMSRRQVAQLCACPAIHNVKLYAENCWARDVRLTHGLAESLEQLEREPPESMSRSQTFIDKLVSHYV